MKGVYHLIILQLTKFVDGSFPYDWDACNILVDPNDFTKVTAILDWEFSEFRPVWYTSYNWDSIICQWYLDDMSRVEFLKGLPPTVVAKRAPHTTAYLNNYQHFAMLTYMAWYPRYGDKNSVLNFFQVLEEKWPKEDKGSELIKSFLSTG
jgi:hypothetical protein